MRFLVTLIFLINFNLIQSNLTSINGIIFIERNASSWPLKDGSIVLIIRNDSSHDHFYQFKLKINQISFPLQFNLTNLKQIKNNGIYLLTLLVFNSNHRLLCEGIMFRHKLKVNQSNSINFLVKDVSNMRKCLSEGYPCIITNDNTNPFISTCCTFTQCQQSKSEYLTCGGANPFIQNISVIYDLPINVIPVVGRLNQDFLDITEKIYQSISKPGTIVKIINGTIVSLNNLPLSSPVQYILKLYLTIISSFSCQQCVQETIHSIQTKSMVFDIPQQDYPSIIVQIIKPNIHIEQISYTTTTTSKTHITSTRTTFHRSSTFTTSSTRTTQRTTPFVMPSISSKSQTVRTTTLTSTKVNKVSTSLLTSSSTRTHTVTPTSTSTTSTSGSTTSTYITTTSTLISTTSTSTSTISTSTSTISTSTASELADPAQVAPQIIYFDPCTSSTICGPGGTCVRLDNSNYVCRCPYISPLLNIWKAQCPSPCSRMVCGIGPTQCVNGPNEFVCHCFTTISPRALVNEACFNHTLCDLCPYWCGINPSGKHQCFQP